MLKTTYPKKEFLVCTEASNIGVGGVLIHEGQVVCYEPWKLNGNEHNYLTHDLELEAVIHALKMWRHYIFGRWFILMSDDIGFKYLFDQSNLNARKSIWLATITEFNFEIRYIKGNENRVTYALSRKVQVNHLTTMSYYGIDLEDHIIHAGQ